MTWQRKTPEQIEAVIRLEQKASRDPTRPFLMAVGLGLGVAVLAWLMPDHKDGPLGASLSSIIQFGLMASLIVFLFIYGLSLLTRRPLNSDPEGRICARCYEQFDIPDKHCRNCGGELEPSSWYYHPSGKETTNEG